MSVTVTGKVFNDLYHTGINHVDYPGITHVVIILECPNSTQLTAQTDSDGYFHFPHLSLEGDYILYEKLTTPSIDMSQPLTQHPLGFNGSTTPRTYRFTLSETQLSEDMTLHIGDFGHDFTEPFESIQLAYLQDKYLRHLHTLNPITGKDQLLLSFPVSGTYYILAFNIFDFFLYGYAVHLGQLFRLSADGCLTFYSVTHLPLKNFSVGDMDANGYLYLYEPLDTSCYIVDIRAHSSTYMHLVDPMQHFDVASSPVGYAIESLDIQDWCFNPLKQCFYSIDRSGQVLALSSDFKQIRCLSSSNLPPESAYALFSDYNGYVYALFEENPILYRLTVSTLPLVCETFAHLATTPFGKVVRCHYSPTYIQLGSAPDLSDANGCGNYTTALIHNGPRHGITSVLSINCDDAFVLPNLYLTDKTYSITLPLTNHTGNDAYLYGWLDYNRNGLFEHFEAIEPLIVPSSFDGSIGVPLVFTLPSVQSIALGETFIRLRLSSDILMLPSSDALLQDSRSIGPASDGQVLDLPLLITALAPLAPELKPTYGEINQMLCGSCIFSDPNGGLLSYTLHTAPLHGKVTIHPTSGTWSYTPYEGSIGNDHFVVCATSNLTQLASCVTVDVSIHEPALVVTTSPSHHDALLGDTLIYTTTIENIGTVQFANLTYTHALPDGVSFIPTSVVINNLKDLSVRPESGIPLYKLAPGDIFIIQFQVVLDSPTQYFSSRGVVEGVYNLSSSHTPSRYATEGNLVEGYLKAPKLDFSFSSHLSEVFVDDSVQYVVRLTNSGDLPLQAIRLSLVLPPELTYTPQLICNHLDIDADLRKGYTIPNLDVGEVMTLQFSSNVAALSEVVLTTTLFAMYHYMLNDTLTSSSDLSTQCHLSVCNPKLEVAKTIIKEAVSLDEVFKYVIRVSNHSSLVVEDVIAKDVMLPELQILDIVCGTRLLPHTLPNGISLGKLDPHHSLEIVITAKLSAIPSTKQIVLSPAVGIFKIVPEPSLPSKMICIESPPPPPVFITDAALKLEKTCSALEASVGETVSYTIVATNTGTITLSQIAIRDLLCPELKFVPGSIRLDDLPMPRASLLSSVTLDTLDPNSIRIITFDVVILSRGSGTLENTCSAHYTYKPHMSPYMKSGSCLSNPCCVMIRQAHLSVISQVDASLALLDDVLHYTVCITNDGDVDLFNVLLTITLNACTLLDGSFTMNGVIIHSVDLSQPISIGLLPKASTVYLAYQVTVIGDYHFSSSLTHMTCASFAYNTMDHCIKYDTIESEPLTIPLALSTFKELSLDNFLDIPSDKPSMELINAVSGQVSLLKHYIIQTPTGHSLEGQKLTGTKLIIHALLELTVEYVATDCEQSMHSLTYNVPFSTFIVLPKACPSHAPIHIDVTIENVSFKVIHTRSFFTTTSLLIVSRIQ